MTLRSCLLCRILYLIRGAKLSEIRTRYPRYNSDIRGTNSRIRPPPAVSEIQLRYPRYELPYPTSTRGIRGTTPLSEVRTPVSDFHPRYPRSNSIIRGTNSRTRAESYPTSENIRVTNPTSHHPSLMFKGFSPFNNKLKSIILLDMSDS